ncbi:MAG TPA: hypothetical protein VIN17_09465 [Paracoccaceae bacterium]
MALRLFPRKRHDDLIVFVHVPKTGGTAINHALTRSGLKGQDHIEHWLDKPDLAQKRLPTLDWVSGHVPYPTMRSFLSAHTPRVLRFFAAIRSPIEQVASHYNWLIEIHHRGPQVYNRHPQSIRTISERIRNTDNTDPDAIIGQLKAASSLFLNQQSRVLLGANAEKLTEAERLSCLRTFDYIGTETNFSTLITKMTDTPLAQITRHNESKYHIDPKIFRTQEMQRFLQEFNRGDYSLYDQIKTHKKLNDRNRLFQPLARAYIKTRMPDA